MKNDALYKSWGLFPKARQQALDWYQRDFELPRQPDGMKALCFGLGRSYGDSCLNHQHAIIPTRYLDHFISFDPFQGTICCEAGVSFDQILKLIVPQGWFLPVTPGTRFVTVGGAIANDVHGKNHHCDGNFGHYVRKFELLRSDGTRLLCSPSENSGYFHATIGGLGLTGAITWAEFTLKKISSPFINQEIIRFDNLTEFFQLSQQSSKDYTYTVSWVDCLARDLHLGRGHFIRGNHAPANLESEKPWCKPRQAKVPFFFPNWALNPLSVKAFNTAYYWKQVARKSSSNVTFDPFFYPLDAIGHWNMIYGRRGFLQWQCVVPFSNGEEAIREIFTRIAQSRLGSFLAVLKTFGSIPSLGILSFPREGVTLALDFPNVGDKLFHLLNDLDAIVRASQGAIYVAKDARMSPEMFRIGYPRYQEFSQFQDPSFSSSFWRRVMENVG